MWTIQASAGRSWAVPSVTSCAIVAMVRAIRPDQWRLLRDIRLRALQDSPDAFLSSHVIEVGWDEGQWRATVCAAHWFVAFVGNQAIGVAAALRGPDTSTEPHVTSMWVDPEYRRRGVARQLLTALGRQVAKDGWNGLLLWVLDGNDVAREAYSRMGFAFTGEHQPPLADSSRMEERMRRELPHRGSAGRSAHASENLIGAATVHPAAT